jgi:uncharacterized Zn finger protein
MNRKKKDFAPRVPLSVRGGIRVQSSRGGFARKWWSRQWLLLLEKYQIGARLGRGRSYAYAGQVASLELEAGRIVARVQGADKTAYDCEIRCAVLQPAAQARVIRRLQKQPLLLAELMVRELPKAIATIFDDVGISLLPDSRTDVVTQCNCPDRVNPCKHLAAVFFLLIEAFDQDPLLLLALRGISREALIGGDPDDDAGTAAVNAADATEPAGTVERAVDPRVFWDGADEITPDFGPAPTSSAAAPLVQRLGPLPLWRGEERFMDVMTQVGSRAVALGWQAWAGERLLRLRPRPEPPQPPLRLRGSRMKVEG